MPMHHTSPGTAHFIDLEMIDQLAEKVENQARATNYREQTFCDITAAALDEIDDSVFFDPIGMSRFIRKSSVQQKASLQFSDLSITLFRNRNFYIELLCWFTASTSIHSHGFCGSFKVVAGSSLHTKYRFTPRSTRSGRAIIGELESVDVELLKRNNIRTIHGGSGGLLHSLFHLEEPSISLLIRTHRSPILQPQYNFYPPGLALDSSELSNDAEVRLLSRMISLCENHKRETLVELLTDFAADLDFARLSWLALANSATIEENLDNDDFWIRAIERHGKGAEVLRAACQQQNAKKPLYNLRAVSNDPELRFFLAGLLNAPDRRTLLQLLEKNTGKEAPLQFIARMLVRLTDLAPDPQSLLREMSKWRSHTQYQFPSRLAPIINEIGPGNDRQTWLLRALGEKNPSSQTAPLPEENNNFERLRQLPELAALWESS